MNNELIYDLENQKNDNEYFGYLEIIQNNNKLELFFVDYEKGLINNRKENKNYSHKGVKIGKAIQSIFPNVYKVTIKNLSFNFYDTSQPDLLFQRIFRKKFNFDIHSI